MSDDDGGLPFDDDEKWSHLDDDDEEEPDTDALSPLAEALRRCNPKQ